MHAKVSDLISKIERVTQIPINNGENISGNVNRVELRRLNEEYRMFCMGIFPFLVGQKSRRGAQGRFCVAAVQCVLNISLNGLYYVKRKGSSISGEGEGHSSDCRESLIDLACGRQRKLRRAESRAGYPSTEVLARSDYS